MGVCTFLLSDASKKWFNLGKIFFDEEGLESIKTVETSEDDKEFPFWGEVSAHIQDEDFNAPGPIEEADQMAKVIAAWMREHPDWRFLSDQDEGFEEVYLAEDAEDAAEYLEEFGDDVSDIPVYMKDGSV